MGKSNQEMRGAYRDGIPLGATSGKKHSMWPALALLFAMMIAFIVGQGLGWW